MDGVAHNMAIECGLSSGFIGDQNSARREPLLHQRSVVDMKIAALQGYLVQLQVQRFSSVLDAELEQLDEYLRKLDTVRIRIDHSGRSEVLITDIFDDYSAINTLTLQMIGKLKDQVMTLDLVQHFHNLLTLLWIKERAGQERGRLNHYFSSGKLSTKAMVEINHYIHEQTLKQAEFLSNATDVQQQLFTQQLRGEAVEYVTQVRNSFIYRVKKVEVVTALKTLLGIGGGLHKFKNYHFTRKGMEYLQFVALIDRVGELLDRYSRLEGVDRFEHKQLAIIEQGMDQFLYMVESALLINEEQPRIAVDLSEAVEALDQLSRHGRVDSLEWFSSASERIGRIDRVAKQVDRGLQKAVQKHLDEVNLEFAFYQNFVAAVIVAMVLALYFWGALLRNIRSTVRVINQVEQSGDLSLRIPVESRDEIGKMGRALNRLFASQQQAVRDVIRLSTAVSKGDFSYRIKGDYKGDMGDLKRGVNGAADRVAHSTQAKDDFLASMSHELRTPLSSIIGNSDYLLDDGICGSKQCIQKEAANILRTIKAAGKNQLALVNDILDMSKIESGKFTIDEAPYDLRQLLHDIEQMVQVKAQDAGISLQVEQRSKEPFQLLGDAQRIGQILINLLGNAIKFTEVGDVVLRSWNDGRYLFFQVKDSGIGMAPEQVDALFGRFEQADGSISRRFGGSGLGLYISLNLAKMMGGTIDVSSEEGKGSIFQLVLPYHSSTIAASDEDEMAHQGSILNHCFTGKVLVAEDTLELQMLERRILESMGITVSLANNGVEAVAQAKEEAFDLILMDMQMPLMDGIVATRQLRREGVMTPIVPLTANVMQKHRDAFAAEGCSEFLTKPIDRQELAKVLKRYLMLEQDRQALNAMGIQDRRDPTRRRDRAAAVDNRSIPRRLEDRLEQVIEHSQPEEEVDQELMMIFVESTAKNLKALGSAVAAEDWEGVRAVVHRGKGSAASFGFPVLSQQAEKAQQAIDQGELIEASVLVDQLLQQMRGIKVN